jgi:hypothetical protein
MSPLIGQTQFADKVLHCSQERRISLRLSLGMIVLVSHIHISCNSFGSQAQPYRAAISRGSREAERVQERFPLDVLCPDSVVMSQLSEQALAGKRTWVMDPISIYDPASAVITSSVLEDGALCIYIKTGHVSFYTTSLLLRRDPLGSCIAEGSVGYFYDAHKERGLPPIGSLEDVTGHVWLSSSSWRSSEALYIKYSLTGRRGTSQECVHGLIMIE